MSDIMAAIGRAQLLRREELADRRQALARRYQERLRGQKRVTAVLVNVDGIVPHIFPIRIRDMADRDGLRSALLEHGIETGVHYRPNHTLTYFARRGMRPLPVTERVYPELLTLPLHPCLTDEDIDYVCHHLLAAIG
jgi:dTDP-4-amino-4,6-dideoxygalactose transaminase